MFNVHLLNRSAARCLAAGTMLAMLCVQAQAAVIMSLQGETNAVKYNSDDAIRLSLLSYNDSESIDGFVERYRQYEADEDHQGFGDFLREQQTRGYVFSKEATGYSIKYAWQDPHAEDAHMVLVITPALKTLNPYMWKTANESAAPFTVLDVNMEGKNAVIKTSLTSAAGIRDANLQLLEADNTEPFAIMQDNRPYYLRGQD